MDTYTRKPKPVQAVQVSPENTREIAKKFGGSLHVYFDEDVEYSHMSLRVSGRMTDIHSGDWLVIRGVPILVMTDKQFSEEYELTPSETV